MTTVVKEYYKNCFKLSSTFRESLQLQVKSLKWTLIQEVVYHRTYSRLIDATGKRENWADTVIRVVHGVFSIRKDWILKQGKEWNSNFYQKYAEVFAQAMFDMKFLPAGRGLWCCGTEFVRTRGSMALNNCAFVTTEDLLTSAWWTMDSLMCGTGVGFDTKWVGKVCRPNKSDTYVFTVPDSREGWAESLRVLMAAYLIDGTPFPIFDYSIVRPHGLPIKGFGGVSSGPAPLKKLHRRIEAFFDCWLNANDGTYPFYRPVDAIVEMVKTLKNDYFENDKSMTDDKFEQLIQKVRNVRPLKTYDNVRLVADIFNAIGACVVAGNIRRSSEISLGDPGNHTFVNLKNWRVNPERSIIMWLSNNSCVLERTEQFVQHIPTIAEGIRLNGEPGVLNQINAKRFGRIRHYIDPKDTPSRETEPDNSIGTNPCGEIMLESYELCNLVDVFMPHHFDGDTFDMEDFYRTMEMASFYVSAITLLPTHSDLTNKVIERNHRVGVGLSGIATVYDKINVSQLIKILRQSYRIVRLTNQKLALEAGINESIRVTTVKPSGTVGLLAGVTPGIHFNVCSQYVIRRIRIEDSTQVARLLRKARVPYEKDMMSDNTDVFDFPVDQGKTRTEDDVSMWEQLELTKLLMSEYVDNNVSVTLKFDPLTEGKNIEKALSLALPHVKAISFLPKTTGTYKQSPYESIDREQFEERAKKIRRIRWNKLTSDVDSTLTRGCDGDKCNV